MSLQLRLVFGSFLSNIGAMACHFADDAGQHIYVDQDRDWAFAHDLKKANDPYGSRLDYFLRYTKSSLGLVGEISPANGIVRLQFHFPWKFEYKALLESRAESASGPMALRFVLLSSGDRWEIEHFSWDYLPISNEAAGP